MGNTVPSITKINRVLIFKELTPVYYKIRMQTQMQSVGKIKRILISEQMTHTMRH
jgi:hypothetical protein